MARREEPGSPFLLTESRVSLRGAAEPSPQVLRVPAAHASSLVSLEPDLARSQTPGAAGRRSPRFPLFYATLRLGCIALLQRLFDWCIAGAEHLPASGPFIVAANHHNYLDGVVLGAAVPRPIAFLVMPRVYHASPLHPAFHRWAGSVPVNLERPDPGAIKRVLRSLGGGGIVGIFPEGPFSTEGRLVPGQPGVAMIALRSGVPVVPAAIRGTYEALVGRRFYVPRRGPLSVRFGAPMCFGPPRHRWVTRADRQEVTRRIMKEIAALLESARNDAHPPRDRADVS